MRKLIACIACFLAASLAGADAGPDPRRHVTVLTWNTEHYNWERHAPGKQAQLEANMFALIRQAKPDVFFIQEIYGAFDRFQAAFPEYEGRLLGRCNGLFSRFPVVSAFEPYREAGNYGEPAGGAFNATVCELDAGCVRFRMGPVTMFWQPLSVHVPEKLSPADLLAWERAPQTYPAAPRPQAVDGILSGLRACLAEKDEVPLLLAGDFNSHSHLDWTAATGAWPGHGGRTVPWDVSGRLVGAGFTDAYRAVHPDPAQDYGATFPVPGVLKDVPAPRARLDYVYTAGRKLRPVSCEVIGGPYHRPFTYAGRSFDMFPSDHAAVRAVFAVETDGRGLVRRGERCPAKTVYDAGLYSQIPLAHITDANRARYLADVRAAGVETVLLSACDFFEQGAERRAKLEKLAAEIRFFREAGVPTMVWSNGFGYGYPQTGTPGGQARFTGAQPLVGVEGKSNGALCPLDPAMRAHLKELVRDVAAAGAEFFLMDDDYVQSARGRLGCACPLHLARVSAKCGRPVTRDDVRASFAGAPNAVRTAFVDVQGEVAVELARELRAEVDKVDPSVGMGICLSYTHWDIEGAEMDDLLAAFAGPKGRKVVRLSGAPYWGDGRFGGIGLEGFIENLRMQAEWTRGKGWTVFDENDPYPRKVAKVPAWRCELYDKATIADGLSARHKYMLCYGPDRAEPGYLEAHLASRADDVRLRALFAGTEPYGVFAPYPRRQIREATLPAKFPGEDNLTTYFSQNLGAALLLRSGIPVRHDAAPDAYAFDPKTLGVDPWRLDYAAIRPDQYRRRILDAAAADGKPLAVHVETAGPRIYQVVRRNPAERTYAVLLENMGDAPADIRIAAKGRAEVVGAVHGPFASAPEDGLRTVLPAHAWAAVRFRLVD